ncbi:MAG: flavin reductase [Bacteroidetes bacterium HGW-Bacteroidetes-17]|jgi:flavin reductase (DIM6/NTAB) family NADH-FMN oxidoreductase RutF|nr:MAG: flavin reductase [Bacteroidetes bacterium HGW-Bacteroidetes-17]
MKKIVPGEANLQQFHQLLLGAVAPRPIALASTIDKDGKPNLSPFSFFNVFGVNPPTLIFSPSRRGRDNTTKDTFENIKQHAEVVINVVNYEMVEQNNLSSNEFAKGVNEFEKSGFTPIASEMVKPFRVKESPVQFECVVKQVIETSQLPAAGNLVICEIVMIHINENVLNAKGGIDQEKIDLIGRLGGNMYCRTTGNASFEVKKPGEIPGIGVDSLPDSVRNSEILTGNDLGKLGGLPALPTDEDIKQLKLKVPYELPEIHHLAKSLIVEGKVFEALCVLMSGI